MAETQKCDEKRPPPSRLEEPRMCRKIISRTHQQGLPAKYLNPERTTAFKRSKLAQSGSIAKSVRRTEPLYELDRNSYSPPSVKLDVKSGIKSDCKPDLVVKFDEDLKQVGRPTFADIIDDWASFSSFSAASQGHSQPTTLWNDSRSLQSCSDPDRFAHAAKPDDVASTAPIDRSIPCRIHTSTVSDQLMIPKKTSGRKANHLSVVEKLRLTQYIHPRGREREENRVERIEARRPWHRLTAPTPEDPFDPEEGIRRSCNPNREMGNGIPGFTRYSRKRSRQETLMIEMYQRRRRLRISSYMRHFEDYVIARLNYIEEYRRMNDSRPLEDSPPRTWAMEV